LIRIDPTTKSRLEALARRTGCSPSSLASEAIEAYVDAENWWLDEIERQSRVHEREGKAPRMWPSSGLRES
jgi:predicted transcriptional regulator